MYGVVCRIVDWSHMRLGGWEKTGDYRGWTEIQTGDGVKSAALRRVSGYMYSTIYSMCQETLAIPSRIPSGL